ncbi:MAG: carboxylating nicotinate-nucleotide diphosphorylase [Oscillospiraceae bacterium]|nr:carboxylating nicotinate-nucleotide diphosphorylase [Oscillospiraceae bacterium]
MMLNKFYIDSIIKTAIEEDINYIDVSADMLIPENQRNDSYFVAKDDGVLCGLDCAMRVFALLDDTFTFTAFKKDGDLVNKGDIIVEFNGKTRELLKGERTALNIIQHMSGIATATNKAVKLCEGTGAQVADTRKTLPGLRSMQKYAAFCGGGRNHRFNLSDGAMLKDNHIDACGGIIPAVELLRSKLGHMVKIEVETRDFEEVKQAVQAGADVIMLDNMNCEQMAEAVKIIDGKALTEASGNITLDNISEVAKTGVDIISLGALTHSVKAFDISMKMK